MTLKLSKVSAERYNNRLIAAHTAASSIYQNSWMIKVGTFNILAGNNLLPFPSLADRKTRAFRVRLLGEEWNEYKRAEWNNNFPEIADALADMLYVILGTAAIYGLDMDTIFSQVHASNLTKFLPQGVAKKDSSGKIIKSKWFRPPGIRQYLDNQISIMVPDEQLSPKQPVSTQSFEDWNSVDEEID